MRTSIRGRSAITLAGMALLLAVSDSARAGESPASRWVGPDAFLYAESRHPEIFLDRVTGDRVQALARAIPGFEKFLEKPEVAHARAVVDAVASALDTTWEPALRTLTGGGLVLAGETVGGTPQVVLVVSPTDVVFLEKAHAKLLEMAREDAQAKGRPDPVTETDHHGITLYSVAPTEAHGIVDGSLVVANGIDSLKSVIDRARAEHPATIADDPNFARLRNEANPEALAWAYARLDRLRALDPKRYETPPDAGAVFVLGPWVESIMKGDWAALELVWTEKSLNAEVRLAAPPSGHGEAMRRYLPPKGRGASEPISVPRQIAGGAVWRDLAAIWEVRSEIFSPETVQGLAQLDTQAGTFFGGRDFGTGVLGALGDHWDVVVAAQDFATADPVPDVKLPAFALVLDLKPDDEEFATRLKSAFQSFIGLVNLGAAQSKAPPLMLGSEAVDGLTIATSRFVPVNKPRDGEPVNIRHNFTPSAVQVGDRFVISSSLGLAKDLVPPLRQPRPSSDATVLIRASGAAVADLLEQNRSRLVMQNMLEKGSAKEEAEGQIALLMDLVRYLGRGQLTATDRDDATVFTLEFVLDAE